MIQGWVFASETRYVTRVVEIKLIVQDTLVI